ncbi:primosomal protein N' [Faucicola atlantae]|uniref:Replication restart protein PriA n=1 Tax=Faucicola atlantae TaxID=34059 RepID=A0A1B8Q9L1_9GAMM|nr:primosomal protein N' [Moraxella atlantae]OBX75806.1 primosomal protein N' [Moraxella atlantae]
MLIQVALPVPLYRVFDYRTDAVRPPVGARVRVPFGQQSLVGIVVAHIDHSELAPEKIKTVQEVLDTQPPLDDGMREFAAWLAQYYHYPLGDVYAVMLPTLLRQGAALNFSERYWQLARALQDGDISRRAHKQREQFALFEMLSRGAAIAESQALAAGVERKFLQDFSEKGLLTSHWRVPEKPAPITEAVNSLMLNTDQQRAVDAITEAYHTGGYHGFLLNGITGSGKTEVYLQAMTNVLAAGQQVLILVPEIGLTPQTRQRFAERFATDVLMLHSGLTDSARLQGWQACREGFAQIIIGTRSAVLYPFANLGMIIVDEAHDLSYKQQDTLRYHATDVALYRGFKRGIVVVLGTATPSLESLALVQQGKLDELTLTARAGNAQLAPMQIVDARQYKSQHGLASSVIAAMQRTLADGEQVLVFLNRRGYAPILLCAACGWQADCPRCDAHLTVHYTPVAQLKCHHCDWQQIIPSACPVCNSPNLDPMGMGTARLVEGLQELFADTPIIQIDRDTTRRKDSWQRLYQQIHDEPSAILVGTQMVAKGHHFANVTLVVMPNADRGFLSADFRSPEHTAQLIVQVAGRAGRADKAGRVLIQTVQPENPALLTLVRHGYLALAQQLLAERKMLGLPPYRHACLVRAESKTLTKNHQALSDARQLLPRSEQLSALGVSVSPIIDAPMTKKNSRYHSQLLLLSQNRATLHDLLNRWWAQVLAMPSAAYMRLSLDIDPVGWG